MVKLATQDNSGAWYLTKEFSVYQDIFVYGFLIPLFGIWFFQKLFVGLWKLFY
jgi:hypothetical protein